jgi:hypothetical protein
MSTAMGKVKDFFFDLIMCIIIIPEAYLIENKLGNRTNERNIFLFRTC